MKIEDCNWMQVEEYLGRENRLVIPLGSIEQHAYLSLGVDRILSERVCVEACQPASRGAGLGGRNKPCRARHLGDMSARSVDRSGPRASPCRFTWFLLAWWA